MTDHEIWQFVGRAVFLAIGFIAVAYAIRDRRR